jgi:excinuclease ABC subunit C
MEAASSALDERAALLRDQIAHLRTAQERQYVAGSNGECDVVAVSSAAARACVCVMFIRGGRNLGSKTYFPAGTAESSEAEVLEAFLPQYYLGREVPREIFLSAAPAGLELLEQTLSEDSGHKVSLRHRVRGERTRWLKMAFANAEQALATRLAFDDDMRRRLEALQDALELEQLPERIECFDISHTGGESTVASCVVFDTNGARRSDYRRFNIEGIEPGDDYAAMRQALERRYTRLQKGEGVLPDILLIDGGKGQLRQAEQVLENLQVEGVTLVGVAKGPTRKPGLEQLFLSATGRPTILPATSPALHLIQQVRDEAHRFAISGHRQRRAKTRRTSPLEGIAGLGPKRRQQLLRQFGGLQGIARAGVEDLQAVKGISGELARRIYDTFHLEG